ncbi:MULTISPECIES: hypothetical protein [Mycobacteriaceae]|uniref:Uncharacterized protein n=1 Tax=Mycolicibacterium neoaurum VKM Ac-1815D TaxID=700508 RepID=V5XJL8_MYCNE|nr:MULTISPECIES: hypothetical protein [Mycobacteriaceae]
MIGRFVEPGSCRAGGHGRRDSDDASPRAVLPWTPMPDEIDNGIRS